MSTSVFTSKKLEKIIAPKLVANSKFIENLFGTWNATVVYIARKKCIVFLHVETLYTVIIPHFSIKDLDQIEALFIKNFHDQLLYDDIDGVTTDYLVDKIGAIQLCKTNNNRIIIGLLNSHIAIIDEIKYRYDVFNNIVILDLTSRLNSMPIKKIDWKYPKEKMKMFIKKNQ